MCVLFCFLIYMEKGQKGSILWRKQPHSGLRDSLGSTSRSVTVIIFLIAFFVFYLEEQAIELLSGLGFFSVQ